MLGQLRVADFLEKSKGEVLGRVVTDAKDRYYSRTYKWSSDGDDVVVQRADGRGDAVRLPAVVELNEPLVAFFGLYSGDGAKGTEATGDPSRIIPSISFSQKEPHLVRFAVDYFRVLFTGDVRFTFSLGEDSAYFMAGEGLELLRKHYGKATVPSTPPLAEVRPKRADEAGSIVVDDVDHPRRKVGLDRDAEDVDQPRGAIAEQGAGDAPLAFRRANGDRQ